MIIGEYYHFNVEFSCAEDSSERQLPVIVRLALVKEAKSFKVGKLENGDWAILVRWPFKEG